MHRKIRAGVLVHRNLLPGLPKLRGRSWSIVVNRKARAESLIIDEE